MKFFRGLSLVPLLFPIVLSGCAGKSARVALTDVGVITDESLRLEDDIRKFDRAASAVKAIVRLDLPYGKEVYRTDAALVVERPDRMRIDAIDAVADVLGKAGSDGRRLWLYLPGEGRFLSVRASRENIRRLMGFDLNLTDLLAILAGRPPTGQDFQILQIGEGDDNHFIVRGGSLHLWTDEKGRGARGVLDEKQGGAVDCEMGFADYRKVDGVDFPHRIEVVFPDRAMRSVIEYIDVSFEGGIDDSVFDYR